MAELPQMELPHATSTVHALFEQALRDELTPLTFLDLDQELVDHELIREKG